MTSNHEQEPIRAGQIWEVNLGASGPVQLCIDEVDHELNFCKCSCRPSNGGEPFRMRVHEDTIRAHGCRVAETEKDLLRQLAQRFLQSDPKTIMINRDDFLRALARACLEEN
jgi:hypothetical protein